MRTIPETEREEIIKKLNDILLGIRCDNYDNDYLYLANKVHDDLFLKADSYILRLKEVIVLLSDNEKEFPVEVYYRNGEVEKFKAYKWDYEKYDALSHGGNTFNFIDVDGEIGIFPEFFLKKVIVDGECMYDEDEENNNDEELTEDAEKENTENS